MDLGNPLYVYTINKTYCETSSKSKWGGRASSWKSWIAVAFIDHAQRTLYESQALNELDHTNWRKKTEESFTSVDLRAVPRPTIGNCGLQQSQLAIIAYAVFKPVPNTFKSLVHCWAVLFHMVGIATMMPIALTRRKYFIRSLGISIYAKMQLRITQHLQHNLTFYHGSSDRVWITCAEMTIINSYS